jgi:DNA invertase Pin-like site-specific DNA recombinase
MIRAVIYSRVSTEGNRQDTERQTNELIEYATKMGYELVGVYEEKVSGFKKNEDRPVFSKMLEEAENGNFEKCLVWVENPVKLTTTFQSKLTTISGAN